MRQTDYVILGLLSEKPLSGYEIKKLIDIRFRFFWSESYGQIFPSLKRLNADGLIEYYIENIGGRNQKKYSVKKKGLDALRQWLMLPVEKESIRIELLLKMYFSNYTDNETMINHILKFETSHKQDMMLLNMFNSELLKLQEDESHEAILKVIDFGLKVNKAYVDWARETIKFLEGRDIK